ncbi:MAG: tRNA preQ1(34) S-adenosylmethionine ribosyltransferase-isomerase QueA [Elusimicrobiota bacterium]
MSAARLTFQRTDYRYAFPKSLIAAAPAEPRDASRLLVLDRRQSTLAHRTFSELPEYLDAGDCLVLNRSKVVPARLVGRKPTGGKAELLVVRGAQDGRWHVLSADLKPGGRVELADGATAVAESRTPDGGWLMRFSAADVPALLRRCGEAPLPPYIRKRRRAAGGGAVDDLDRYQTVYAREEGSIAAPTAGLHFTPELLARLRTQGVRIVEIILHVGLGTFLPVSADDIREHAMLAEAFTVPAPARAAIAETRRQGARVIAVGTTATRTLETGGDRGETDIFIRPGHRFSAVDALLTNFHQPESTPLLLACAFAGRDRIMAAYREAIEREYRLFSYGDSMLIL